MKTQKATLLIILLFFTGLLGNAQVHTSYLWHLEQPNYWPETSNWNPNEYQKVWESQYLKQNNGNWYSDGQQHPLNNLQEIFNNDDRKAVYQYRTKDAIQSLLGLPEAGAQVSYSGCLMENVKSLSDAGQWGYSSGWENNFITARNWTTTGGKPRMDMVGFSMDHALSPLVGEPVLKKQIEAHRFLYGERFGTSPNYSKGYWPAECSFSERIIKVLVEEGFEWSIIANSHLARTLNDYPLQYGTSGCNIDPPNKADKVSVNGNHWWSGQIDGRGGTFAAPYCYQAHKSKYVDPATGVEYKITVVPMDDLLSYQNGYSTMGTSEIESHIAPYDDPSHPSMVLMAHDGDNAWGGGYDYYTHSVPDFANLAASKGYVPTTIQQFLTNHPVPETDVVHVEDGSWFNAANDWGHPQFINWLWPMYTSGYQFNPDGWTEDTRNWAVLVAAENRVVTAEALQGTLSISNIVHPAGSANAAEKAWHYLLPAYNSGYMYYGTSLDMEVKQTLACNHANSYANQVISSHPGVDNTAPTVFIPQRYPYNPGGVGFGPTYGYQQHQNSSDFYVWTFAYDVSGIQNAVLKYRLDSDGSNPLSSNENETYTGGSGVGAWQELPMSYRQFPTGNVTNNPDINFFILPDYIAGEYYAQITGLSEKLVDYYVEVTDTNGNICKSPIQHVYVGTSTGTVQTGITWSPQNPTKNDVITITENGVTNGANLHWGVTVNSVAWQQPNAAYWPSGSAVFNGTGPAIETPMTGPVSGVNTISIGPFNNPGQQVASVDFVMHYSNNTWNNNSGADFHIPVLNVNSDTLLITPSNQSVLSAGGTVSFTVTSNTAWVAASNQSWCTVTASGTGNGTLQASCTANTGSVQRIATITLSASGLSPLTVTVTQAASDPHAFKYTLANDQQIAENMMEFDVLVLDTDSTNSFELGGIQAGILVNPGILNGGTLTAAILPGTSTLNAAQQPTSITFSQSQNCIKLAPKAPPGIGNGSILSTDPQLPTRICRIRLTNSVPFAQATADLSFNFTSIPYPTKVSQYYNGLNTALTTNSTNCFSECANILLNPPATIVVAPTEQTVSSPAGSISFDVTSNAAWNVVSSEPWCTVTPSGYGNGSIQASYTANESTEARNCTLTVSVNNLAPVILTLTQNGIVNRTLQVSVFLESLYDSPGHMHPAMDESGAHWGSTIADKIVLELHDAADYSSIVYSQSNVDLHTDGTASILLPTLINSSYYLTVLHRNSIETVSSVPIAFNQGTISYAFDQAGKAYGANLRAMPDGYFLIWGGDANQDGLIDSSDMVIVDNDASSFTAGYVLSDLNGDGLTDSSDMVMLDNNSSMFIAKVTP